MVSSSPISLAWRLSTLTPLPPGPRICLISLAVSLRSAPWVLADLAVSLSSVSSILIT